MKISVMILKVFIFLLISTIVASKRCPGKCTTLAKCKEEGGRVSGYCTPELACCDYSVPIVSACDVERSGLKSIIFQSPSYPSYSSGEITCPFRFELPKNHNYDGLLIEFLDVNIEGTGFNSRSTVCQIDMILFRGFSNWQPPSRCGYLNGYAVVIDKISDPKSPSFLKALTIVSMMSSGRWKWKIKISVFSHGKMDDKHNSDHDQSILRPVVRSINNDISTNEVSYVQIEQDESEDISQIIEEPLVVNGVDTSITEVPWQASLRTFYPQAVFDRANINDTAAKLYNSYGENCSVEGSHFCGGSIISNQFILTAGHCFQPSSKFDSWKPIDQVKVYLGETDLCMDDMQKYGRITQNFSIEKIIMHYGFDSLNMMHDVILLKLKEKIVFNDYIKPIALSKRNKTYPEMEAKLSGWGRTNLTKDLGLPAILQSTDKMEIADEDTCHSYLQGYFLGYRPSIEMYPKYAGVFSSQLCTRANMSALSKLAGQGDSGGPLIVFQKTDDSEVHAVQVGVVSYGMDVFQEFQKRLHENVFVDFFQDVSYYRDWIDLAMLT